MFGVLSESCWGYYWVTVLVGWRIGNAGLGYINFIEDKEK